MVASGALMLIFGSRETSDTWADALRMWWSQAGTGLDHIRRLVIYPDNGPKNSGRRTQFLKRMVQFADWSGLEIRLVYYPPYHSKYNPIERCWSALERKWNGVLLTGLKVEGAEQLCTGGEGARYLRLWPHRHATDGFFAAVWNRK